MTRIAAFNDARGLLRPTERHGCDETVQAGYPVTTNPMEQVGAEIKRRDDVVGITANENSVLRHCGAVLLEMHDERAVVERCYLSAGSPAKLYETGQDDTPNEVERAHSELVA